MEEIFNAIPSSYREIIARKETDEKEFPKIKIAPASKEDLEELFESTSKKAIYYITVKVLHQESLRRVKASGWPGLLTKEFLVRDRWRALYKPPVEKRTADLQWRIIHRAIATDRHVAHLNPAVGGESLKSNPSHLRELDLSGNNLGDSGVKNLSDLLMNPQFKLEKLHLNDCSITEKQSLILTSALKSNPSHLRELYLSWNNLGNTGVKHLCAVLKDSHCKLERLRLSWCYMTDEGCSDVTSALKSNPSHLRELDLSENNLGDSGVKNLSDLLMNPQFKLEKLHLRYCDITDVSSLTQSLTNSKALQFLKELDLRENEIGDSKQRLRDELRDSNCVLR
ncbi:ribonuclease inhibitor [Pimephales promelas]|nr:ribonuclease inhibitor [Pimephales promelas]